MPSEPSMPSNPKGTDTTREAGVPSDEGGPGAVHSQDSGQVKGSEVANNANKHEGELGATGKGDMAHDGEDGGESEKKVDESEVKGKYKVHSALQEQLDKEIGDKPESELGVVHVDEKPAGPGDEKSGNEPGRPATEADINPGGES